MARKTKVVGFSLPPELHKIVEQQIKKGHKTRSEFFRGMIETHMNSLKKEVYSEKRSPLPVDESDLAKILQTYWLAKSQSKLKIIITGLGIIVNKDNKVLIGARKKKDKWVENLTWVFPGGKMESLNFEKNLINEIKGEIGLDVKVNSLVDSRIHPDSGYKPAQIVALYFFCTPMKKVKAKPGSDLGELKWVNPTDVFKYFTTSTSDNVTKFLYSLKKS